MFLIAGIQPKTRQLDDIARRCPACGQFRAYRKRVDHYLSLFFIPLLKVKTGEPFLVCDRCAHADSSHSEKPGAEPTPRHTHCQACGRPLKREFFFCPYCGSARGA